MKKQFIKLALISLLCVPATQLYSWGFSRKNTAAVASVIGLASVYALWKWIVYPKYFKTTAPAPKRTVQANVTPAATPPTVVAQQPMRRQSVDVQPKAAQRPIAPLAPEVALPVVVSAQSTSAVADASTSSVEPVAAVAAPIIPVENVVPGVQPKKSHPKHPLLEELPTVDPELEQAQKEELMKKLLEDEKKKSELKQQADAKAAAVDVNTAQPIISEKDLEDIAQLIHKNKGLIIMPCLSTSDEVGAYFMRMVQEGLAKTSHGDEKVFVELLKNKLGKVISCIFYVELKGQPEHTLHIKMFLSSNYDLGSAQACLLNLVRNKGLLRTKISCEAQLVQGFNPRQKKLLKDLHFEKRYFVGNDLHYLGYWKYFSVDKEILKKRSDEQRVAGGGIKT